MQPLKAMLSVTNLLIIHKPFFQVFSNFNLKFTAANALIKTQLRNFAASLCLFSLAWSVQRGACSAERAASAASSVIRNEITFRLHKQFVISSHYPTGNELRICCDVSREEEDANTRIAGSFLAA